jgi:hypothetical protein
MTTKPIYTTDYPWLVRDGERVLLTKGTPEELEALRDQYQAELDAVWVEPILDPITVSAVSALLALAQAGLYDLVHTTMTTHPMAEVRVWYARTINWEENHPYIQTFGPEFGLTDEQIHNLFVQAQVLDQQLA